MRLFVGVTPPPAVLEVLRRLDRPDVPGLRWTTPEQWHVTLRFLGEVADADGVADSLGAVPAALRAAGAPPTVAVLGPALAWFPGRRVLQVPVAGLDPPARAVARATASWSGGDEPAAFTGHLTLARMRGQRRGPARLAGAGVESSWTVEQIELVSSTPGPGGSRYRVIAAVPIT